VDSSLTTNTTTTGTINLMNGIGAGTDITQRVGRKATMKSVMLRYFINALTTTSATQGDVVRVMLVLDMQTNGALPAVGDILQTVALNSALNLNNRDRFKILYDHWVTMNANTYTAGALVAGSPTIKHLKVYKKISSDIIFSGTANTIGSIATGGLYLVTVSAVNLVSNIAAETRVRFIDN